MKKLLFGLTLSLLLPSAFAGHGRDGGWPESIQLLRISKQNLLDLLNQATDKDVQDAINGMRDRTAYYMPEEINVETLKFLVSRIEELDVLEIEKSKYEGVKLFDYDDSNPLSPRIFATKNFYNKDRYGRPTNEITVSLVKEVERLLLHEVSHLWGFGEETPETNYAEKFAVKMIDILHGIEKKSFTMEEKMKLLSEAFALDTMNTASTGYRKKYEGKVFSCLALTESGESTESLDFDAMKFHEYSFDGLERKADKYTIGRNTVDDYLIFETANGGKTTSRYHSKGFFTRGVSAYKICHEDSQKLNEIEDRFLRPHYSRSNLMTDFDHSSTNVFKSLVLQRVENIVGALLDSQDIQKKNQDQYVHNVDIRLKKNLAKDYEWLISRRHKYSKTADSEMMQKFNLIIHSDILPNPGNTLIRKELDKLSAELKAMKNYARANYLNNTIQAFLKEYNKIIEEQNEAYEDQKFNLGGCGREKRVGQFYACQIELIKTEALERKNIFEKTNLQAMQLQKKYAKKISEYQD